jgi:hypothetical protein
MHVICNEMFFDKLHPISRSYVGDSSNRSQQIWLSDTCRMHSWPFRRIGDRLGADASIICNGGFRLFRVRFDAQMVSQQRSEIVAYRGLSFRRP